MRTILKTIGSEAYKQHRISYHSNLMYFSALIWPVLQLITVYFSYKPFSNSALNDQISKWFGKDKIFVFIVFGYVGYMFFRCFIQSAWMFSRERIQGTLELIYISPANRMGVVIGNAIASLFESIWLFTLFCFAALFIFSDVSISHYYMIIVAVLCLLIPSICWGAFTNALFLFSRDTRSLFSILDEPMEIFAGVKIPFMALPIWAKILGGIFPLTWSLSAIRKIFIFNASIYDVREELVILLILCTALVALTKIFLYLGERFMKRFGTMERF